MYNCILLHFDIQIVCHRLCMQKLSYLFEMVCLILCLRYIYLTYVIRDSCILDPMSWIQLILEVWWFGWQSRFSWYGYILLTHGSFRSLWISLFSSKINFIYCVNYFCFRLFGSWTIWPRINEQVCPMLTFKRISFRKCMISF